MAHGGARPGAGRKKGATTKLNEEARKQAAAGGLMPLDFMLAILRNVEKPDADRFEAAKAAAPYVHAKLSAVEVTGEITTNHDVSDRPLSEDEWAAEAPVTH